MRNTIVVQYFSFKKDSPSVRYRGLRLVKELALHYPVSYAVHYPSTYSCFILCWRIVLALLHLDSSDVIIIQKICRPSLYSWLCRVLAKLAQNTIYDIDDAIYFFVDDTIINDFVRSCKIVLVGSDVLVKHFRKLNQSTFKLTTPVYDTIITKSNRNKTFTIGWIGTFFSHRDNVLQILLPAIHQLSTNIKLSLIGVTEDTDRTTIRDYFADKTNVQVEFSSFSDWENDLALSKEIVQFDVGTSPLIENEINEAKSAFKIKQYQACGLPVLASPIGENTKYIKHRINGYLCHTVWDWVKFLNELYNMTEDDYLEICKSSLDTYRQSDYRLRVVAKKLHEVIFHYLLK